jgi:hypothetical protein
MLSRSGGVWSRVDSLGPEKSVSFMAKGTGTYWAGGNSLWRATGDPAHAQWTLPRGLPANMALPRFSATGKHVLASYYASVGGETLNYLAVCPVDGDSCRVTPAGMLGKPQFVSIGIANTVYKFAGTGDTVLAATDMLLHQSLDGGLTWNSLVDARNPFLYAFLGKRLFSIGTTGADCGHGLCWQYSDNLAETWTSIFDGGPDNRGILDLYAKDGGFFTALDSAVFVSRDGIEWKALDGVGAVARRMAVGDGMLAAGTDDSRLLIRELESVGLDRARSGPARKAAVGRLIRSGIFVQDSRGILRRMDGKAAAASSVVK